MRHVGIIPTELLINRQGSRRSVSVVHSTKASVFSPKHSVADEKGGQRFKGQEVFTPDNPVTQFDENMNQSFSELLTKVKQQRGNMATSQMKRPMVSTSPISTFMKPFLQLPMQKLTEQSAA